MANQVTVNVGDLSNALALAVQQAIQPGSQSESNSQPQAQSSTATGQTSGRTNSISNQVSQRSQRSACNILPSFLKRKSYEVGTPSKRPKVVQFWDRDIVCLPQELGKANPIPFPRGRSRARLCEMDLIGKIRLSSAMTVQEVEAEVRSTFKVAMGDSPTFPFVFLQPTGAGSRSLTIPTVSASFMWTAQQVARLASSKQCIFILAKDKLTHKFEEFDDVSDEEEEGGGNEKRETEDPPKSILPKDRAGSTQLRNGEPSSTDIYQSYANIIDLTLPDSDDESSSDELPPTGIDLHSSVTTRKEFKKVDVIVSKHALLQHQPLVIGGDHEEDFQRVNVRRSHLLKDAFQAFSKPQFDCSKMLKVNFVGESSIDDGGPRREFFQLLMRECFSNSGLFTGWPNNAVPMHNVEALATNKFYLVGKMVAISLVQGGQPPLCLSQAVADYIVYDEVKCEPSLEDIPDYDVKEKLEKVRNVESTQELQALVEDEMQFRFDCGYSKATQTLTMADKDVLIKGIWLHFVYFMPLAELQQFRKGFLETLKMELFTAKHPDSVHMFLVSSPQFDVTVDFFMESFCIMYSPNGSNKRTSEEAIILAWNEYIGDCNGDPISLGDVLHFLSGSTKLPAAGFDRAPSIHFTDDERLPQASTCDLSVTFSRSDRKLMSVDGFKEKMDMAIRNSFGFGFT